MDVSARRFDAASLRTFVARTFETVGMPVADASIVAELMISADLAGAEGHGIFRLPQYVRRICAGGINLHPNIRIARERDGMALIDGDNGMGHLVMARAAETAIELARTSGIGWVGARHSNHAGASRSGSIPLTCPGPGRLLHPPQQRTEHGVGAVPVRPQLHRRPVPQPVDPGEGRPGVEQLVPGHHLDRLGRVRRARHVGDDPGTGLNGVHPVKRSGCS